MKNRMRPIHPGEILKKEFFLTGLTASALARAMRVPPNLVWQIIAGKRRITARTAILLGAALGTTPDLWLHLQMSYDLRKAEKKKGMTAALRRVKKFVRNE